MTSSTNDLIAMAKSLAGKADGSNELEKASPELLAALESVAQQLKQATGTRSELGKLADQVSGLVNQTGKK